MNCDGTTIQPGELGGIEINYGQGSVIVGPSVTAYTLELPSGTYSITLCSLDSADSCYIPPPGQSCTSTTNPLVVTVP